MVAYVSQRPHRGFTHAIIGVAANRSRKSSDATPVLDVSEGPRGHLTHAGIRIPGQSFAERIDTLARLELAQRPRCDPAHLRRIVLAHDTNESGDAAR